jgi:hypothetical protein
VRNRGARAHRERILALSGRRLGARLCKVQSLSRALSRLRASSVPALTLSFVSLLCNSIAGRGFKCAAAASRAAWDMDKIAISVSPSRGTANGGDSARA